LRQRLIKQTRRAARQELAPLNASLKELRAEVVRLQLEADVQSRGSTTSTGAFEELRLAYEQDRRAIADLTNRLVAIDSRIASYEKLLRIAEDDRRETAALVAAHRTSLDLLFGPAGRDTSRFLDDDEVQRLVDQLAFLGEDGQMAAALAQAYRLVVELELRGPARLRWSTSNALATLTIAALMPVPSGEVLALETQLGLGLVATLRQLRRRGLESFGTIVVPPTEPSNESGVDAERVAEQRRTLEFNLALGGIAREGYRVVETVPETDSGDGDLSDRAYGVILIGSLGDEERTLDDLLLADRLAAGGALVFLDGFGDPCHPGIERGLDAYVSGEDRRLVVVGTAATTAVLRAGARD
jgi:hypothetical protein